MESKKINQLATELAPELSDLTIIGDPTTGISKKITLSQMASLFTGTVEEYANLASFPLVGTADTIYIALDTNVIYRWNTGTSSYVELSPNIVTSLVFSDANGFDGTISLVGSTATLSITTALTTGSAPFIGASGALTQDNSNYFWDNTNKRLGINTNSPTTALDVFGSGIIGRLNGTSTNNAFLGFASAGSNKWSIGNVQSDHRFRIYSEANTSELISVLQTGQFGIGIANPTTKLHIDGGSSALIANLDADVSVAKSVSFRSDNSARINLEVSGTESGSNAGANLFIRTYTDAGSLIETPFQITRSTGVTTVKTLNVFSASGVNAIIAGVQSETNNPRFFVNANESTNTVNIFSSSSTGSDNLVLGVGGGSNLYIKSGGNVGIGALPNSSFLLDIYQSLTSTTAYARIKNNRNRNAALQLETNLGNFLLGVGIGADANQFQIYDNTAGANRLVINSTGASTFSSASGIGLTIQADWNRSATNDSQLYIKGTTNGNKQLRIGYDTTGNVGYIQALTSGTSVDNLLLNPSGGNIGIGTATPNSVISLEKAKAGSGVENLDMISCRLTGSSTIGDSMNIGFFNATNINIANIKGILGGDNVAYGSMSFATRNYFTDTMVEVFRINSRGNMLVGTTTDNGSKLNVNGIIYANSYRLNDTGGGFVTWTMQDASRWSINYLARFSGYGAGTLTTDSSGNITASSDRTLKNVIKPVENVLDKIMDFEPVYFKWNEKTDLDKENVYISTIAQSIEKSFPEATGKMADGTLTVQDRAVMAILVKAIQELNAKIK